MSDFAPQFFIRPIEKKDLSDLCELARESGLGFTSLPNNEQYLRKKIECSLDSFLRHDHEISSESYLLVMEDVDSGKVIGTSGIASAIGLDEPFYTYRVNRFTKKCKGLDILKKHEVLVMNTNYEDYSEICTLFLLPAFRKQYSGQLLSRCRFLFMAEFSHRFNKGILAEMRGISYEDGYSPFWNAVGRRFYGVPFPKADYLTGMGHKQFISDLMPEFPIYVDMLPQEAQECIGEVHTLTKPALKLLEREGFHYRYHVDIFDAGPSVECWLNEIKSVQRNIHAEISTFDDEVDGQDYIITNNRLDFRACLGYLMPLSKDKVTLPKSIAQILRVQPGDSIRYIKVNK